METIKKREALNKGELVGQKPSLKPKNRRLSPINASVR